MHRRYDKALFAHKVNLIKEKLPDAFIGVDVMVGCRGDTPECFEECYEFLKSLPVTQLHVFPYSERPGTAALKIPYVVDENENQGNTALQQSENPSDANHKVQSSNLKVQSIKYFSFTGTVSYVDGDRMVITVPDSAPLLELQQSTDPIGVQLSFDETSYKLMFEALDRVMKAKNNRLAYLRDLFYSHQKAGRFSFEPMKFPWLNPTQERAVNEVLWAKDVAIVHGPPGTGKTTTLVEAINETLMRESQVLVCAQSNMAVDWISEKLVDRGINVLRIGNPTRVNDKMLGFTYERRFESHADYPQLWAIRKAIRELRKNRKKGSENYHQKMDRLKSRAAEIELRINAELFGEARVIACTLVGSAHHLLEGMKFGTLFIDEAAQALEAACWIPMKRASRVILAGDHCQLPPTVKSIAALRAGLGKTLMERIAENKPEVVTLLKIQYRMNDEIMRFSSDWFYGGKVESAPQTTVADELKENLEAVENFKGSRDEKLVVLYCKQLGINYKNLSEEEFRWFIRILKKSKKMGTPISQRKKR